MAEKRRTNKRRKSNKQEDNPGIIALLLLPIALLALLQAFGLWFHKLYYKALDKRKSIFLVMTIVFYILSLIGLVSFSIYFYQSSLYYIMFIVAAYIGISIYGLVSHILPARAEAIRLSLFNINNLNSMTWQDFERFVAKLYGDRGYTVKFTKGGADYGADVIASNDLTKLAIQVKYYNDFVGIKAVQEAISAVAFHKCTNAVVITNSVFTQPAINLARANNVLLIDKDSLVDMIKTTN